METKLDAELGEFAAKCLDFARKMHKSDIRNDIRNLWKSLTVNRESGLQNYFQNAGSRRAYVGYYFPMYVAKVYMLVNRLKKEGIFDETNFEPLKIWDLGSGTLTGMAALKMIAGNAPFKGLAVDKSLAPMRLGLDVISRVLDKEIGQKVFLRQANVLGPIRNFQSNFKPNLIFLGHLLNELGEGPGGLERKMNILDSLFGVLDKGGAMIIVEPATHIATRNLMKLRDYLNQREDCDIVAPCTGSEKCPLLETSNSWCFSELKWNAPEVFKKIDQDIGFERETLKTSFLFLRKGAFDYSKARSRIVSGEMISGSNYRRYVCTPSGLKTLTTSLVTARSEKIDLLKRGELLPKRLEEQPGVRIDLET